MFRSRWRNSSRCTASTRHRKRSFCPWILFVFGWHGEIEIIEHFRSSFLLRVDFFTIEMFFEFIRAISARPTNRSLTDKRNRFESRSQHRQIESLPKDFFSSENQIKLFSVFLLAEFLRWVCRVVPITSSDFRSQHDRSFFFPTIEIEIRTKFSSFPNSLNSETKQFRLFRHGFFQ